jgi:uncharacterized membrane protein
VTGLLGSITFRFRRDPGIRAEDTGREAVMRWRTEALWEYARGALWVLPGISLIAAPVLGALLSKVRVGAGMPVQRLLFQGTADDARTLLIGITGTVITVIALVLGLTLVALQLSSTQCGARSSDRVRVAHIDGAATAGPARSGRRRAAHCPGRR